MTQSECTFSQNIVYFGKDFVYEPRPGQDNRHLGVWECPRREMIPLDFSGWEHDPMENPFPVSYMVKLKEVTPRWKQRTRELIESAARRRRRGNQCYSRGRYDEAQNLYESSLSIIDIAKSRVDVEGAFMDEVSEAERACLLNMAACLQRMGR